MPYRIREVNWKWSQKVFQNFQCKNSLVFDSKIARQFSQDFGGQQSAAGAVLPEQNDHPGLAELLQQDQDYL